MKLRKEVFFMGNSLPFSTNIDILNKPLIVGEQVIPNRFAIQPMEGADSTYDGAPDELTFRRYRRFAKGGAGLIWIESVAVTEEGKSNPRHLYINENNLDSFKRLAYEIKETAMRTHGTNPVIILQATHAGRHSMPYGNKKLPVITHNNPLLEKDHPLPPECIVSDDELKVLEEKFIQTAILAHKAGFDGVDIKACHGYLVNELLASHNRPGLYGGSFENRIRFLCNVFKASKDLTPKKFLVTSRLNIYDACPYPYGFGSIPGQDIKPDLSDAKNLLDILKPEMINITMGNPCPGDLDNVLRMCTHTKEIQSAFPKMAVVGSGVSYMKDQSGELAAGYIETGVCKIVGWGRMSFAYPDFAKDIMTNSFDKNKTCICCSGCGKLIKAKLPIGCVVRDDIYNKLLKESLSV